MKHAKKFRDLRSERPEFHFTSRWPFLESQVEDSPEQAAHFWPDDYRDVEDADIVIVYAEEADVLRGAIAEAGAALATGRYVIVIGEHESYSTWQYHPNCVRCSGINNALNMAAEITKNMPVQSRPGFTDESGINQL